MTIAYSCWHLPLKPPHQQLNSALFLSRIKSIGQRFPFCPCMNYGGWWSRAVIILILSGCPHPPPNSLRLRRVHSGRPPSELASTWPEPRSDTFTVRRRFTDSTPLCRCSDVRVSSDGGVRERLSTRWIRIYWPSYHLLWCCSSVAQRSSDRSRVHTSRRILPTRRRRPIDIGMPPRHATKVISGRAMSPPFNENVWI